MMESINTKSVSDVPDTGLELLVDSRDEIRNDTCDHTLDKLRHLGTDYLGDIIVVHFHCDCGRCVDEVFAISETKVF